MILNYMNFNYLTCVALFVFIMLLLCVYFKKASFAMIPTFISLASLYVHQAQIEALEDDYLFNLIVDAVLLSVSSAFMIAIDEIETTKILIKNYHNN